MSVPKVKRSIELSERGDRAALSGLDFSVGPIEEVEARRESETEQSASSKPEGPQDEVFDGTYPS